MLRHFLLKILFKFITFFVTLALLVFSFLYAAFGVPLTSQKAISPQHKTFLPEKHSETHLHLQNPLNLKDILEKSRANLGDLLQREENKDLAQIRIIGKIETQKSKQPGKTSTRITWDHLEVQIKDKLKSRKLSKNLESAFLAKKQEISPLTKIKAQGDLKNLIREARLLLSEVKEEVPLKAVDQKEKKRKRKIIKVSQEGEVLKLDLRPKEMN